MTIRCEGTRRPDAMRDGADRLCLWRLCGRGLCLRAKACRGDPEACTGLMRGWLAALAAARYAAPAAPSLERAERRILTREEARLFTLWMRAVEEAELKPEAPEVEESAECLREELTRRIEALSQTMAWEDEQEQQQEQQSAAPAPSP